MMILKTLQTELAADDSRYVVEAYASTRDRDLVGDVIAEGAFVKSLQSRAGKIAALWQHDPRQPVGRPLEVREDSRGLFTVTQFNKETTWGRDAYAAIKAGDVTGVSIGFDIPHGAAEYQKQDGQSTRVIKEVELYEYSFVTFPANETARVLGAKSAELAELALKLYGQEGEARGLAESAELAHRVGALAARLHAAAIGKEVERWKR